MRTVEGEQSVAPKDVPNAELLARLEKLEALIAAQNREGMLNRPEPTAYSEAPPPNQPSVVAPPMSPQLQKLTDDALWLERSFTGQSMLEPLCDPISFRTCPVRRIVKQGNFVLQSDPSAPSFGSGEVTRCIWLPRRDEARILTHKYITDVNHFHHVVHVPTLMATIEQIYDCIDSNTTLDIGVMALLLSMCAASTYTWSPQDDARLLYGTVAEARAQAFWWVKAALDVMDHAQRIGHASLECIHGMVILFYVFCNIEGLSPRARSLNARSISMARELSLHRVDAPSNREIPNVGSLRVEMYRRTWWFLVATDWMVTQFAFPQEGSFTIHPFHMMAWRIMDDAKDQSPIGAKLLDLSVQVLKRHTPSHPALKMFSSLPVTMPMTPDSAGREEQRRNIPLQGFVPEPEASYMDQQWQALEGRMDLNTIDFDKLFYGLEAPFI
ncbi:Fungal transcriptional regulatory protein [Cordyceps fumosorosea ARSEF 2679]|uniref:Fungal transcriptional regulatory protein n=1 Tax=Cordyceps fumosorosea (strain ARSEF 2679) TaxID=1081104 RepID=A0A167RQ25_CORFA|nr:Fungal transcriptional regulatory protein [Cordyceps fumosorosea ARSEF 2679]OAA58818.1 Fungal transcriptional regulatory protein [Cordyceps fumosorosea ARSEF 2679]